MIFFSFISSAFALAELIDNSLSATARNTSIRSIQIKLVSQKYSFFRSSSLFFFVTLSILLLVFCGSFSPVI